MTIDRQSTQALSPAQKRALLAELLQQKAGTSTADHPISYNQWGMWYVHQIAPDMPAYNIGFALRIRSEINSAALSHAFQDLVDRHASLRTTFTVVGDVPQLCVHSRQDVCFESVVVPETDDENSLRAKVVAVHKRPFDLEQGPLFRVYLFSKSSADHVLLVSAHHIVTDGWSLWLLLDELHELYPARAKHIEPNLPPLAAQYVDFVTWQTSLLESTEGEKLWHYWQNKLAGDLPTLDMPTDRIPSSDLFFEGAVQSFTIDESLTTALRELARTQGVTLYMLMLSAFFVLLHRYSGQQDIVIGSPVNARSKANFAGIVGCFVNSILLRAQFSEEQSFVLFLEQMRHTVLDALNYQDYPYSLLTKRLAPKRDLTRSPLFQVEFAYHKPQHLNNRENLLSVSGQIATPVEFAGLKVETYRIPQQDEQLNFSLEMMEGTSTISGSFKYNTAVYDTTTIAQLQESFLTLLRSIISQPEQPVTRLTILSEETYHCLLTTWNQTDVDFPRERCFHELFEAQVAQTPHAPAVIYEDQQITYDQFNRRANRLAHILVDQGVGPDTVVALLDERSIDLLTAMLAVFKAGGAYLPLDPKHPPQRIAQILTQSQSPLVLYTPPFAEKIAAVESLLEDQQPRFGLMVELLEQGNNDENVPARSTPDDLAYVIFTSGSTGLPKGAMVEQKGMINHLYAKINDLQLTEQDRVAQTASQCFDISVWQFLSALAIGGQVYIYPDEVTYDPPHLIRRVADDQISILETVPSMMQAMLDAVATFGAASPNFTALRWFVPTGEALPPELSRQWFIHFPNIPLVNAYGPTECSDDVTHYPIYEPPAASVVNMPIGRPIQNMRMYVLDQHRQPLPVGVPGELYIGGIGVGRGYLNDDQRTGETFLPDPFSAVPNARLYKTGDLVRYLPDGNLEFLGRLDHQVKIRGFRIELGEIEVVLRRQPEVREAIVVAHGQSPNKKSLVAYVVPEAEYGESVTADVLNAALRTDLPDYMIPSTYLFLTAFPLTSNGKINRKALPEPQLSELGAKRTYTPARSAMEKTIAQVWQTVLEVEQVGIHDNFFEVGGHSLLMTQVQSRLRKALELDLSIVKLFQYPTIATLADYLDQQSLPHQGATQTQQRVQRQKQAFARQKQLRNKSAGDSRE